ncbi:zinc-binding dehydrogenase [Halobacterium noricense]|uniref:zinc-binding dehydrogenase n=1 Tax=Halobacterium noricense TaxID=223182 RepID=UPI001E53088B|nr:zinc-binding dehydrogenase [Halobacterium noricense]UHH24810.1 zinc-binding dehydrogenase [Halobacterium noricense]
MQAVQFAGHGGTEVVEYGAVPDPEVGRDEVLVDVKAGSLNHLDVWTRRGMPQLDLDMPHVPGSDAAGVVVDHVGEATWSDSLRSLAKGGRLVTCGATTGGRPETHVQRLFWNQLSVLGSTMATLGEADDALSLVWDGTFDVRIRDVLPMSETARAHELLENREGFGKVVVIPDSER